MVAKQPIRSKEEVHDLMEFYIKKKQYRNYVLINMGIYTALRISDLLKLKWRDVYNFRLHSFHQHISLYEQKTGKYKSLKLNQDTINALKVYFDSLNCPDPEDAIFRSNRKNRDAISRIQAYRIIRFAADSLHINESVSCHSLRKTFGYHAWKSGASVIVIMDIYNHTSLTVTKRYLGISQDGQDEVYNSLIF